jgi:hypothetical protein
VAVLLCRFDQVPELVKKLLEDFGGKEGVMTRCACLSEEDYAALAAAYAEQHHARCSVAVPAGVYNKIFPGDGTFFKAALQFFLTYVLPLLMQKVTPPAPPPAE